MSVTLIHGDCLHIMPGLEENSVDAIITDPPYMVTDIEFDESLSARWAREALRVVKDNGYLCSFGLYEVQHQIRKAGWVRRFTGVWLKEKGGMRSHNAKMPMSQQEPFVVYAHPNHKIRNLTYNTAYRDGEPYRKVMRNSGYKRGGKDQIDRMNTSTWTEDGYVIENDGKRQMTDVVFAPTKGAMPHWERTPHPTQKPLRLMSVIVEWLTNEGDLILDPFMGSGTTGMAAILEGRAFIGIEQNREYLEDIARPRIAWAQEQRATEQPRLIK